ncbi:TPA: ANR family transcriptional regulator [Escherichia coli]
MEQIKKEYRDYKYISPASEAAKLERKGDYVEAFNKWNKALYYANGVNNNWCMARAEFCKKRGENA